MIRKSFTIMEILLAMSIIGILAAVSINTMGRMSANKIKVGFQNDYRHMVETINSILADETRLPIVGSSSYDETGHSKLQPLRNLVEMNETTGVTTSARGIFPKLFLEASNATNVNSITSANQIYGYQFTTKNGSDWRVIYNRHNDKQLDGEVSDIMKADYLITFDVNGKYEGPNCPFNMGTSMTYQHDGSDGCKNPDTFRFGLTYDNKIMPDNRTKYNGQNLKSYMRFAGLKSSDTHGT